MIVARDDLSQRIAIPGDAPIVGLLERARSNSSNVKALKRIVGTGHLNAADAERGRRDAGKIEHRPRVGRVSLIVDVALGEIQHVLISGISRRDVEVRVSAATEKDGVAGSSRRLPTGQRGKR